MIEIKSLSITLFLATIYLTLGTDGSCVSLAEFTDYSSSGMSQYIPQAHQTEENIALADSILARKYETERRSVSEEYGFSFCIEPEIFDYVQRNSNDKTIIELGAAEGDISILLAFGSASKVYVNDITPGEIEKFKRTKASLPEYVQAKLTPICCNYMEILKEKPELRASCDFVLFRNGFHFLRDADYHAFFTLIKNILKPGGQVVMNAMSYQTYIFHQLYQEFLDQPVSSHPTRFKEVTISAHNIDTQDTKPLFRCAYIEENDDASLVSPPETSAFMTRTSTQKWQIVESSMRLMPKETKRMFNEYKKRPEFQSIFSQIKNGGMVYSLKFSRYFSPGNLYIAFNEAGFLPLELYVSNLKGHLVHNSNDWTEFRDFVIAVNNPENAIARVGIIATMF